MSPPPMNPGRMVKKKPALILAFSPRRRNRCFRVWSIGTPYVCEGFRGSMREIFTENLLPLPQARDIAERERLFPCLAPVDAPIWRGFGASMPKYFGAILLPAAFFHQSQSQSEPVRPLRIMNLNRNGKMTRRPDCLGEDGWWMGGESRMAGGFSVSGPRSAVKGPSPPKPNESHQIQPNRGKYGEPSNPRLRRLSNRVQPRQTTFPEAGASIRISEASSGPSPLLPLPFSHLSRQLVAPACPAIAMRRRKQYGGGSEAKAD
jgi:hypothetical protein